MTHRFKQLGFGRPLEYVPTAKLEAVIRGEGYNRDPSAVSAVNSELLGRAMRDHDEHLLRIVIDTGYFEARGRALDLD